MKDLNKKRLFFLFGSERQWSLIQRLNYEKIISSLLSDSTRRTSHLHSPVHTQSMELDSLFCRVILIMGSVIKTWAHLSESQGNRTLEVRHSIRLSVLPSCLFLFLCSWLLSSLNCCLLLLFSVLLSYWFGAFRLVAPFAVCHISAL